jgi:hypothetical protein
MSNVGDGVSRLAGGKSNDGGGISISGDSGGIGGYMSAFVGLGSMYNGTISFSLSI